MCTTGGLSWPRRCSRAFRWPSFTTSSSIALSRASRWERSRDSPMAKRKGMDRRQFVRTTEVAAQQGHDLFQFLSPPGAFEPQVLDMADVVKEAEGRHGPLVDLCKRSTY